MTRVASPSQLRWEEKILCFHSFSRGSGRTSVFIPLAREPDTDRKGGIAGLFSLSWQPRERVQASKAVTESDAQKYKTGMATLEGKVWQFLTKLAIRSSNCIPWYLPKKLISYVHTKACTQMFTPALFTIAKTLKQPKCPSIGEWINKLWYIHSTEHYSVTKEMSSQALRRHRGALNAYC